MDFRDNKAIYLQIADFFCENILLKKWKEGERVPSVRETAVDIEVNPNTVMRTFNYLQDMDIIFNKRGIGYFVSEGAFEKTLTLKKDSFIKNDLPLIFKTMQLLNIDFDELKSYYDNHKN
ncbi:GntR family transcriptional regulator [Fulvivirgaceae bacterium BMA10]|uniref:GntR family transcriptional regulator n=1 Tax=Splendidivirga corallicola TaxID=3051826 RepID=A0ABT8KMS1_9BACT|nr:GntR family transcriptional regulator [Fulvivirgaceae bacterium BMA10]